MSHNHIQEHSGRWVAVDDGGAVYDPTPLNKFLGCIAILQKHIKKEQLRGWLAKCKEPIPRNGVRRVLPPPCNSL